MKRSVFIFLAAFLTTLAIPKSVMAYVVSAVAPSGQTLYYDIDSSTNHYATVTPENGVNNYAATNTTGYLTAPSGVLVIPDSITYNGSSYPVTNIGDYAFCNCQGLTSIVLPNTIRFIGYMAFYHCSGMTSIDFPNSLVRIDHNAFQGCQGLTSIIIPNSVTSIGHTTFSQCSNLVSFTIGNSVTYLGESAFYGCTNLQSIIIPDGVTSIRGNTFEGCSNLTSVSIGNGVTTIGSQAFSGCGNLSSIEIPDNVTGIWGSAFAGCGLRTVTIGNGVTHIESRAFYLCDNLTSVTIGTAISYIGEAAFWIVGNMKVYCKATTPPEIWPTTFNRNNIVNNNFYVPCNSVSAYQNAANWDYFASTIYGNPFLGYTSDFVSNNENMGSIEVGEVECDSTVTMTAIAEEGYYFVRWSDGDTINPRTVLLSSDTSLTAIFDTEDNLSISEVTNSNIRVYTYNGCIVVEGAEGMEVKVFDIIGRPVDKKALPNGVYVVKIGNLPIHKAMVIR